MTRTIEKIYIEFPNDPSVGLFSSHFELSTSIDLSVFDGEPQEENLYLNNLRQKIGELYEEMIGDGKCRVYFDFELFNLTNNK